MASSKRVSVSKAKLAETGEELEVVGAVAAVERRGQDGRRAARIWRRQRLPARSAWLKLAAGASDLTSAVDAGIAADRMQTLSDIVGEAGVVDVAEGVDMLLKGGDVKAMGAIVGLMSWEDLDRGMELARMAGEMAAASNVVDLLEMPVLALFLNRRGTAPAGDRRRATDAAQPARGRWPAPSGRRARMSKRWASRKSPRVRCGWPCRT